MEKVRKLVKKGKIGTEGKHPSFEIDFWLRPCMRGVDRCAFRSAWRVVVVIIPSCYSRETVANARTLKRVIARARIGDLVASTKRQTAIDRLRMYIRSYVRHCAASINDRLDVRFDDARLSLSAITDRSTERAHRLLFTDPILRRLYSPSASNCRMKWGVRPPDLSVCEKRMEEDQQRTHTGADTDRHRPIRPIM